MGPPYELPVFCRTCFHWPYSHAHSRILSSLMFPLLFRRDERSPDQVWIVGLALLDAVMVLVLLLWRSPDPLCSFQPESQSAGGAGGTATGGEQGTWMAVITAFGLHVADLVR